MRAVMKKMLLVSMLLLTMMRTLKTSMMTVAYDWRTRADWRTPARRELERARGTRTS
jgi:hypothetical protein